MPMSMDRSVSCQPQVHGPAAFLGAIQAVRAHCGERDPALESTETGQLGRVIAAWDQLPEKARQEILKILPK